MTTTTASSALPELSLPTHLLDYGPTARYLGTTERHVRQLWAERKLSAVKVGRRVRFRREDLDAYIRANLVEAVRP